MVISPHLLFSFLEENQLQAAGCWEGCTCKQAWKNLLYCLWFCWGETRAPQSYLPLMLVSILDSSVSLSNIMQTLCHFHLTDQILHHLQQGYILCLLCGTWSAVSTRFHNVAFKIWYCTYQFLLRKDQRYWRGITHCLQYAVVWFATTGSQVPKCTGS